MPPTESKHYHWKRLEFYAQRGMITVIDEDSAADSQGDPHDAIKRIRPGDFMKRVLSARMALGDKYPDEVVKTNRLLDQAKEVCKIAIAQGDPGDPKVTEHFRKHKRRSSILTPGEASSILGPVGGPSYKIKLGDPREMILNGVQVVPDLTIGGPSMITPQIAETMRKARRPR